MDAPEQTTLFIGALLVAVFVYAVVNYLRSRESHVRSSHARLVEKRVEKHLVDEGPEGDPRGHREHDAPRYYGTFEMEHGERREFLLHASEYGALAEGDRGVLRYQGEWFKDFARDAQR